MKNSAIPRTLKLALVFPPGIQPSSPPLGIAQLKAYLHHRVDKLDVRLFDLNLSFYEQALRWLNQGRLKMRLKGCSQEESSRRITQAARTMKGLDGEESFFQISQYDQNASNYRSFELMLSGLFDAMARKILVALAVPEMVKMFFDELYAPVRNFEPDFLGFSVLFSQQLPFALCAAKCLKHENNKTILGGATLAVMPNPEFLLAQEVPFLVDGQIHRVRIFDFIDYLIVGEGEQGLEALLDRHEVKIEEVPGLVYRHLGTVRQNPPRAAQDLDSLPPPDFCDFQLDAYHAPRLVLPILSSRGCFFGRCAFCTHQLTYLGYREESASRTVEKLLCLRKQHGTEYFSFVDEMIHPNRFRRLSKLFKDNRLSICYSAYAKPVAGFSAQLLNELYEAGARVIMWGVESGAQRVLNAMRKGTRVPDMRRVLRAAHKAGIWNLVFIMFGFPTETLSEWEETVQFLTAERENIDAISRSRFLLLPGSRIFMAPQEFGIVKVVEKPFRDPVSVAYDYEVANGLSQEEANRLYDDQIPILKDLSRTPYFGAYRDHMLIHAARNGESLSLR